MYRKQLVVAIVSVAALAVVSLGIVSAAVTLVSFTAEAQAADTILVEWETASESGVLYFELLRSETESPEDWGQAIDSEPPKDPMVGGTYFYTDTNVAVGIEYWYLLREVTNAGPNEIATASAGIGLPTRSPTPTRTARPSATSRSITTSGPPTATRRFTDGPPTAAPGTPTVRAAPTSAPPRAPAPTPSPGARLATPTGPAPRVTIPVAPAPTVQLVVTTALLVSPVEPTATPALVSIGDGTPVETPTPLPTKDATPVIFSSDAEGTGSPTPAPEQAAAQGGRSTALPLVLGGSAIGLAGLAVALVLFLRSRRS